MCAGPAAVRDWLAELQEPHLQQRYSFIHCADFERGGAQRDWLLASLGELVATARIIRKGHGSLMTPSVSDLWISYLHTLYPIRFTLYFIPTMLV